MSLTARDVMQARVHTVSPDMTLPDLEREFLDKRVSGFPVLERGKLVGIISRSDVVRQMCAEQSLAETVSDYYGDVTGWNDGPRQNFAEIAGRVGQRIEHLHVGDAMIRRVITVRPECPVPQVAAALVRHGIHRLPVTDAERLLGIISSLDLVRLLADGRVSAS